jgi:phage/plasmid primase-like uncharacterized protein
MSLIQNIVSRYGGWLAADKRSGAIPAPGHSRRDRSVSLRLNADGKLLIHCFSDTDWRDVKAMFLRDGAVHPDDFVSRRNRSGGRRQSATRRPARQEPPQSAAHAINAWSARSAIAGTLAETYLASRGLNHLTDSGALGFLAAWPMSQRPRAPQRPCLIARISDPSGSLQGVQATFLFQGRRGLSKRRLVYGRQKGFAIHLDPPTDRLLVGEGLESTASAAIRFAAPAWSLLNTANLSVFHAPPGVSDLIIACDNDKGGRVAAEACADLNSARGIRCDIQAPAESGADWNDADRALGAP